MPSLSTCLSQIELEQFLLGITDDACSQEIEEHVQSCSRCQRHLAELRVEDELVVALRGQQFTGGALNEPEGVPSDLVNLLVQQFKRIANTGDGDESTPNAAGDTDATVDYFARNLPLSSDVFDQEAGAALRQLGRYEIRGQLGRGGMGAVLHGFDSLLKRSVAIKVLQTEWLAKDGMAERLVREAQAAAVVVHDNIVPIYGIEFLQNRPCIVMPLLVGETLQQRLERHKEPMPLGEFLRIARGSASGLAAAHSAGLIHCDMKPANLWLEAPGGRVKILDFGLAIRPGDGHGERGTISGTPGYIAPEQARGGPVDQRADIFSLGCVFYRMATRREPFSGKNAFKALWTVLATPPAPASTFNSDLPAELSDLISRMMSRNPEERPATASEVIAVLDDYESQVADRRNALIRRRRMLAGLGAAVLGGAGVGMWAMFTAPRAAKPVPVTFFGNEQPLDVVLQREGREWPLTLGPETTLSLPPGDYTVRPVSVEDRRTLVPDRFVVTEQASQVFRIAFVGEIARHSQHTQQVTGLILIPGSETPVILSVGQDRALVRWEPTKKEQPTFVNLSYSGRCIAISPGGDEVATAGGNKTLPSETIIELRHPNQIDRSLRTLAGHARIVSALSYSPDGKWLASSDTQEVLLWNRESGTSQRLSVEAAEESLHSVNTLVFSNDGRRLLTGGDRLTEWDLATMSSRQVSLPGESLVRAMRAFQNGFVTAGDDGIVRIWTSFDTKLRELKGIGRPLLAMAVSADGDRLFTGDVDGNVCLWSVTAGELVRILRGHSRSVQAVEFLMKDRQAVSAGSDGTVRLWQLPFP